jgi:hypothetical protein
MALFHDPGHTFTEIYTLGKYFPESKVFNGMAWGTGGQDNGV